MYRIQIGPIIDDGKTSSDNLVSWVSYIVVEPALLEGSSWWGRGW
jgi:hypothetical protein